MNFLNGREKRFNSLIVWILMYETCTTSNCVFWSVREKSIYSICWQSQTKLKMYNFIFEQSIHLLLLRYEWSVNDVSSFHFFNWRNRQQLFKITTIWNSYTYIYRRECLYYLIVVVVLWVLSSFILRVHNVTGLSNWINRQPFRPIKMNEENDKNKTAHK